MQPRTFSLAVLLTSALFVSSAPQAHAINAGSNRYIDYNEEIDVPYSGFAGQYFLNAPLIHSPWYGPFFKNFGSPISDTLEPILLDAEQPSPLRITESYYLPPILAPILTLPVSGWYEEIFTDGWQWVIPGDPRFPWLFPEDQSLITKNGKPHPWVPASVLAVYEPEKVWVLFPPLTEGDTLGIHKAMLWVGTPGNSVWGDHITDDGAYFDESSIRVYEYPFAELGDGLLGDLNADGFVGQADLNIVLGNWNQTVPPGSKLNGDPTGDGYVGIDDLNAVLGNWNAGIKPEYGSSSIPEPTAVMLVLPGAMCLFHRR